MRASLKKVLVPSRKTSAQGFSISPLRSVLSKVASCELGSEPAAVPFALPARFCVKRLAREFGRRLQETDQSQARDFLRESSDLLLCGRVGCGDGEGLLRPKETQNQIVLLRRERLPERRVFFYRRHSSCVGSTEEVGVIPATVAEKRRTFDFRSSAA